MRQHLLVRPPPEQQRVLRLPAAARLTRRARLASLGGVAVVLGVASAPDASADEHPVAVELGARLGFGLPFGSVDAPRTIGGGTVGDPLAETASVVAPVWFDLGVRFATRWYVGLFASIAPGLQGT